MQTTFYASESYVLVNRYNPHVLVDESIYASKSEADMERESSTARRELAIAITLTEYFEELIEHGRRSMNHESIKTI